MALDATDSRMRAPQRKLRPGLMIKEGWLPFHAVVALGTTRNVVLGELFAMNILMAALALSRGSPEVNIYQPGLPIWGLMAIHARCGAVGSEQRELCC